MANNYPFFIDNGKIAIHEGYSYKARTNKKRNITYYYCEKARTLQCPGNYKLTGNIFQCVAAHKFHAPNPLSYAKIIFLNALRQACERQIRKLDVIYRDISHLHEEAASALSFIKIKNSMKTWQTTHMQRPEINSFHEFKAALYSEEWKQLRWYDEHKNSIEVEVFNNNSDNETLVLYDERILRYLRDAKEIYIVTMPITARDCENFTEVTLVGAVKGRSIVPCLIGCARNPNFLSCCNVVEHLVQAIPVPNKIYTNFQSDMHRALNLKYPGCTIKGCFENFCYTILNKAEELNIPDDADSKVVLRKLMALILLPEDEIRSTLQKIKDALPIHLKAAFLPLLDYTTEEWVLRVGAQQLSNYQDLDAVTDCPRNMRNVLHKGLGSEPSIWEVLTFMQKKTIKSLKNKTKVERSKSPYSDMLVRYLFDRRDILTQWKLLTTDRVDRVEQFLAKTSFILREFFENMTFSCSKPLEDVQNMIVHLGDFYDEEMPEPFEGQILEELDPNIENQQEEQPGEQMPPNVDQNDIDDNAVEDIAEILIAPRNDEEEMLIDELDNDIDFPDVDFHYEENGFNRQKMAEFHQNMLDHPFDDVVSPIKLTACIGCKVNMRIYMAMPCRHVLFCFNCTEKFISNELSKVQNSVNCPSCRQKIADLLQIYI